MQAEEKKVIIAERIQLALSPDYLKVIDESHLHVGHAGHQGGGRHFAVEIGATSLASLSRVEAHRKIYDLLSDLIPDQIHALRIVIRK